MMKLVYIPITALQEVVVDGDDVVDEKSAQKKAAQGHYRSTGELMNIKSEADPETWEVEDVPPEDRELYEDIGPEDGGDSEGGN